jgi:hypothetical protein
MSEHELGSLPGNTADSRGISVETRAQHIDTLAQYEHEQLARAYADIERAAAALRRAEPALESWIQPASPAPPKPRPLWLLIGVLWLSTAIVTAGAVAVIASLAG